MLWQSPLPEKYTQLNDAQLAEAILARGPSSVKTWSSSATTISRTR